MTLAELETLARLRLPVTVVVFDDAALSLIEVKQKPGQGGSDAVRFAPVDYAQVAAAMGLESTVVTTAAVAVAVFRDGWDRPRLIDARIDPSTYAPLIAATRG
jgi:acetolactate synthase-1/2/3 large subunit